MKQLIILTIATLSNLVSFSQDVNEIIYQAYLSQKYEVAPWKEAIKVKEEQVNKNPKDAKARYELALAQFALVSSTMRNRDENLFDEYYDPLLGNIKKVIESEKNWAEPYALQSAAYGVKMGYSPMQGMFLGNKSNDLIEKAKRLDPNSALAWKVYANSKFFTPEMWGGDIDEAIAGYEKAIQLYESNPAMLKNNWMYIDALAFLGQAFMKKGKHSKAITAYEKALKVEADFTWVKYVLLPKAKATR